MKKGSIGDPETPVINYNHSRPNNTEERSSELLRGGSLKSRVLNNSLVNVTRHFEASADFFLKVEEISNCISCHAFYNLPNPVAARSKAWVCSRSRAGITGSNPAGGINVCLL